jgi:uncharacterized membrane protein
MRLSAAHWVILFTLYGYWGWLSDSLFLSVKRRKLTNGGFLHCPVMPFYGITALLAVFASVYIENPYFIFILNMFTCCLMQYIYGLLTESFLGIRFNDFSHHKMSIKGRVNFISVVLNAATAAALAFYAHGKIAEQIEKIPLLPALALAIVIILVLVIDACLVVRHITRLNVLLLTLGKNRLYSSAVQAKLRRGMVQNKRLFSAFPNMRHVNNGEAFAKVKDYMVSIISP